MQNHWLAVLIGLGFIALVLLVMTWLGL